MNKTVVIYRSKYGSTKKYAEWIANAINEEMLEYSKINTETLLQYDTIVFGGGLYASGINYEKLSFLHKSMMAMLKLIISKKKTDELTKDDKGILDTYGKEVDFTDIKTIEPLVSHVKSVRGR